MKGGPLVAIDRPPLPNLPALSDPNSGARVDDLGRHLVGTNPQSSADLIRIPGVESRPMLGGLRSAHHYGLLVDAPGFTGAHVELTHRTSVVVLNPWEGQELPNEPGIPEIRIPPVSDPLGTRMCANAAARA